MLVTSIVMVGVGFSAMLYPMDELSGSAHKIVIDHKVHTKEINAAQQSLEDVKVMQLSSRDSKSDNNVADSESSKSKENDQSAASPTTGETNATKTDDLQKTTVAEEITESPQVENLSVQVAENTDSDIQWLITRESHGDVNARNGAYYGIGQLADSYYNEYVPGQEYHGNYAVQLEAMQKYIAARYGTVAQAIAHWKSNNWY